MKINEFIHKIPVEPGLHTSSFDLLDAELPDIFKQIEQHCSEALSAMRSSHTLLYRGYSSGDGKKLQDIFIGNPRTDRDPMSNGSEVQNQIDNWFKQVGFKALRSNSLFTTSDFMTAREYSNTIKDVFIIFPLNGFNFTWSSLIHDLYIYGPKELGFTSDHFMWYPPKISAEQFIKRSAYSNKNFIDALKTRHEILINGKYLALRYEIFGHNVGKWIIG